MKSVQQYIETTLMPFLISAIAFTLPWPLLFNNIAIMVAGAAWLVSGNLQIKVKKYLSSPFCLLLLAFFVLDIISWGFISINKNEAYNFIIRRLAFVVLPLIITTTNMDAKGMWKVARVAFCSGIALALGYSLVFAVADVFQTGNTAGLFYHQLAHHVQIHAVYLAAYTLLALVLVYKEGKDWLGNFRGYLLLFHILMLVLLSSKLMIGVLGLFMLIWFFTERKEWFKGNKFWVGIAVVCLFGVFVLSVPKVRERFITETTTDFKVLSLERYRYDTHFTGTSIRLLIWKLCAEIAGEHRSWIWGVGTGDKQDLLDQKYRAYDIYTGNPELKDTGYLGYGPHNQFVESLYVQGAIGLILLLVTLVFLFRHAFIGGNTIFMAFMLLTCLFFLTESVLTTNKGIVFFVLFATLFMKFQDD